jgi:hypothetical protein
MTARLYTLDPLDDFRPKTFAGHKNAVLNAYFSSNSKSVSVTWDFVVYPVNHYDPLRYTLSAVTVLCSSGEPKRPTLPLIVITCQLLQIPRLLMFVGGFINDTTSTNPTRRSFAVLSISLQGYSSSASHLESSGSGRCPHSQTCIY